MLMLCLLSSKWIRSIIYFFQRLLFQGGYRFTVKLRDFSFTLSFHTSIASSIIEVSHWSDAFVTADDSTLTCCSQPKSVRCIRAHIACCTFYRFSQVNNDMHLSSPCHTQYSHFSKISLCPAYSSLPTSNPWQQLIFLLSP